MSGESAARSSVGCKKNKNKCRCLYRYLVLFLMILLAELFVFNYRHWESLGNREISLEAFDGTVRLGNGYRQIKDRTYLAEGGELDIVLEGINEELKTSCIKIQVSDSEKKAEKPVLIRQLVTDESHRLYYELPVRELWAGEARSSFMTYHLYGKCKSLWIIPDLPSGAQVIISISLNPVIPIFFSWERVLVLFIISGLVCLLRPSSKLHQLPYLDREGKSRTALLLFFFVLHALLFFWFTSLNPYFQKEVGENQKQYQKLAESLKEGKLFIMEEPAETLKSMENPYDYAYRNQLMEASGEWYQWDYAYYEGKYYVYFGVVPALLFYLPYYLVTGSHISNHTVILLLALLFLSGVLGVIHELIRRWFPKISLACWFLLTELLLLGSNTVYMTKRPDLYTVPILSGLSFGLLGLWCFLRGIREEKVSSGYTALGSFLTALIAGCRPQLFVFVLPSVLLLKEHMLSYRRNKSSYGGGVLIQDGKNKAKRNRGEAVKILLFFIMPMLLVAAGLMYYNYSRFGNVFDFGANYNLTFNDMRRRGFHADRIPLGIFAYLLQPVKLIQSFPFAEAIYFDSQYMGVTIQEATYGGLFMTSLFAWFGLLPLLFPENFKKLNQSAARMALLMLAGAMAVIVADTNMSGILMRYFSDFSMFFMLAAAISALALLEHFAAAEAKDEDSEYAGRVRNFLRQVLIRVLLVCLLWGVCTQGMTFFLDTGEALRDLRPDLYSHVKYLAAFWL